MKRMKSKSAALGPSRLKLSAFTFVILALPSAAGTSNEISLRLTSLALVPLNFGGLIHVATSWESTR
jgi:hypothetical protein